LKLKQLLHGIITKVSNQDQEINITGIANNSMEVKEGFLFVAITGYQTDGHAYIKQAIKAGAKAIIGEQEIHDSSVPYFKVENSRAVLADLAKRFYPAKVNKTLIGVTGTNGKTTTSFMLKHIMEVYGKSCSLFGSVYNYINGEKSTPSVNTTMDALQLQKELSRSQDEVVIMEVSSHALSQYRVKGISYDYALFTNLDHDHLDYHKDMDDYFSVKAQLFNQLKPDGAAVINTNNTWGNKLKNLLSGTREQVFCVGNKESELYIQQSKTGDIHFIYKNREIYSIKLSIKGKHNIQNAALAFLTAREMGVPGEVIMNALHTFPGVPGRFEVVNHPTGAQVIIDYAHTCDAFAQCLKTGREMGAKRIIHIFGFRGNRDVTKRRSMVEISEKHSDQCILTLDDLGTESFEGMIATLQELKPSSKGKVIPDRTSAIEYAWKIAREGDWIFITGKGDEGYKDTYLLPTNSDKETVTYLLKEEETAKVI
jgi:UDP-N-acetylmuramoyl-L-alanyl-D-glutamate--2,6-diaminopimelate ligase